MANVSLIDAISEVVQWFPRNKTYAIPGRLRIEVIVVIEKFKRKC